MNSDNKIQTLIIYNVIVPKEEREKYGFTDALVRFSVGIEDVEQTLG